MTGNRWTVLLVRGDKSPVRQYSFSPAHLRLLLGVGAIVFLVGALLVSMAGPEAFSRLEARRLGLENDLLRSELATLQDQVVGLEDVLGNLSQRDAEVRRIAGIESLEEDVLLAGVGGPGLEGPESHPLFSIDPALGEAAFAATYDLEALDRRALLLSESMAEAEDTLRSHRNLLESTPSILPTAGLVSSRFSSERQHPLYHRAMPHEGIDVSAPRGTPILAAANGKVLRAGWTTGYGQLVEVSHGYGYVTRYGHASRIMVRAGQTVSRGEIIAQVGNSGIATSPHLHYEVLVNGRAQNPMNYVLPDAFP
jgi:murein DD-endopeptidase MepM/ murein hydrolase activator NlpD